MSLHPERDRLAVDPAPAPAGPPRRFTLPPGAVDTHAHVIGDRYIDERSYTPHPAPVSAYRQMLDATGMTYGVLVQVSVHGTDNMLLTEALAAHRERLRGIAVVPHDAPEADLRSLKEAGVVGLRLNTTTGGGVGVAQLARYEAICIELGWHLQFLIEPGQLAALAPKIARLRVPAVFDHMGYVRPAADMADAAQTLCALVHDGAWVKLSGAFRTSDAGPPYGDTTPFTRTLIEAAPTRCVWGSDWPHVSFRGGMPRTGDLLDLLTDAAPDAAALHAILVDNPQRLYGF